MRSFHAAWDHQYDFSEAKLTTVNAKLTIALLEIREGEGATKHRWRILDTLPDLHLQAPGQLIYVNSAIYGE